MRVSAAREALRLHHRDPEPLRTSGVSLSCRFSAGERFETVLKGWCAELGEDFLNVPAALPQAMQASSAREHERCTTAAIQFLGMCSKVSECDPPAAVAVGNGKRSCR